MLHLLLVEDNAADILLFREGIRQGDVPADVMIARDSDDALRLLNDPSVRADFLILDINLPRCSGLQLLEQIDSHPPVVVYTCSQNPNDRDRAVALGAIEFVVKPVGFAETIEVVGRLMQRLAAKSGKFGSAAA